MKFWSLAKVAYDSWKIRRQMKKMGLNFEAPYAAPPHKLFDALANDSSTVEDIIAILDQGYDVNELRKGDFGIEEVPLDLAAKNRNPAILKLLLERGANPDVENSQKYAPLHYASTIDHVRLLIEHGAKYPSPTSFNETPIRGFSRTGEFEAVLYLLEHGGSRSELEFTQLHEAVAFSEPELVSIITPHHLELEKKDTWDRTPLALAVHLGKIDDTKLLVENFASLKTKNHVGSTLLHFAAISDSPEMVQLVLDYGLDLNVRDQFGNSAVHEAVSYQTRKSLDFLLDKFKVTQFYNEILDEALGAAYDFEIIQLLLARGANPNALDSEGRRLLDPQFSKEHRVNDVSKEEFERGRRPRFGTSNPEEIVEPFWQAMIFERCNAYRARTHFGIDPDYCSRQPDPVWCAQRFGQSITHLPDGRVIEIAGEHEDGYDPDFCIYNDVFVHEPGKDVRVFCYPREAFPPTDFHSATLVGDWIYIIGSLGYPEDRILNVCPVYRLNIHSFQIEKVETTGDDPGRIHRHRAWLVSENEIGVADGGLTAENQKFDARHAASVLNLETFKWSKLQS